jgi:predicted nucleic acid-binding protein
VIVVDSSVLIDHLNGKLTWQVETLRDIGRREILLIGDIVLLEVLQGVRGDRHAEIVARSLRAYATAPMLSAELAFRAAAHHRALRRLGITVRTTIDLIMYCCITTAIFCPCLPIWACNAWHRPSTRKFP